MSVRSFSSINYLNMLADSGGKHEWHDIETRNSN